MNLKSKLKLDNNFILRMNGDEGYLMNCLSGDVFEINATTMFVINRCTGNNTIGEILNMIYEVDDVCDCEVEEEDILELCNYFIINNICTLED